jgi:drug/metabolite transporter (DMT)-like permease
MTILESEPQLKSSHSTRAAELALLFATLVWGSSFTWAKASGDKINQLTGAGVNAMVGPLLLMSARFLGAGVLWLILFPQSRRGWTGASLARGVVLGFLLGSGLVLQVLGLDRTSEAVSAFLTSLTILWVPAIMTLWLRKPPQGWFWIGVVMAAGGTWLMNSTKPGGFGLGEVLGLACSIAFSVHIIALNALVPRDNPWRMTAAQLLTVGLLAIGFCLALPAGREVMRLETLRPVSVDRTVWIHLLLLIFLPTLISFGIMSYFQPRVDPSRAALIYLMEPIFAAAYAWIAVGRSLGPIELIGASLILAANAVVEILAQRGKGSEPTE